MLVSVTGNNIPKDITLKKTNNRLMITILIMTSKTKKAFDRFSFIYPFTAPAAILSTNHLLKIKKIITIGKIETANPIYNAP